MSDRPTSRSAPARGPFLGLYNAFLAPLAAGPWIRGRLARRAAARGEWAERLGETPLPGRPGGLWIHGASAGEARLVRVLAAEIRRRRPELALTVSSMTSAGRALLPRPPDVDTVAFVPLDFRPFVARALARVSPRVLVLVETELWPNLIATAGTRGVACAVVNGRLSPERVARYRRWRGLYRPLLRGLARIGVAGPDEAERFVSVGALPETVVVTGNLKFDLPPPRVSPEALRRRFGLVPDRPVVVAGSTGPGEDFPVLDAFAQARDRCRDLFLVLAPRHRERFADVAREAARRGLRLHRLSTGRDAEAGDTDGLLVDTIGELATLYALGDAAFVGGTLVPVGGHNLLEPVAAGVPVVHGPHVHHVVEVARVLGEAGASLKVRDASELAGAWVSLVTDRAQRARRAEAGETVLARHRGALDRTADLVLDLVGPVRGETAP